MDDLYGVEEEKKPSGKGMDERELLSHIAGEERRALGYMDGDLSRERAKSLDFYLGKPLGNEVEGRSQVVSSDVFDVVEGMLPSLMRIFTGSATAVEFEAFGPEDEGQARAATEACNHVFYKQNNGALVLYQWMKDALVQKNGYVKWYYEEEDETRLERYEGLTDDEFTLLVKDDNVEVLEHEEVDGIHSVRVRVRVNKGKVCVINVPPEEVLVSGRHGTIGLRDAPFVCHRTKKTISDLREMGYGDEDLKDVVGEDSVEWSQEYMARRMFDEQMLTEDTTDESMRQVWVSDCYLKIDFDGDGIAELRRVLKAGNVILENEEIDQIPFAAITPIVMPHQHIGRSIADVTQDIQITKTTVWRQSLDNLYLTNHPRHAVIQDQVNLDDLLTSRPGGIVRMRTPNAVMPLVTPFVAQHSFPMIDYLDSVREVRTGVTKYNQGTDADSLNKTASGISQIMAASQQRLELVARLFAETGLKDMFRGILKTLSQSGMARMTLMLSNQYVAVDPREWDKQWNMRVNVGLGTGNKDAQLAHLATIGQIQQQLKATGRGYMVTEANEYATAAKIAENAGFRHPEMFFTDPRSVPPQAKQQPPAPEIVKMQMEAQESAAKLQFNREAKQLEAQMQERVALIEAEARKFSENLRAEVDYAIAQLRAGTEKEIEGAKISKETNLTVFGANSRQAIEERKIASNEAMKRFDAFVQEEPIRLSQVENAVQALANSLAVLAQQIGNKKPPKAMKKIKGPGGTVYQAEYEDGSVHEMTLQ